MASSRFTHPATSLLHSHPPQPAAMPGSPGELSSVSLASTQALHVLTNPVPYLANLHLFHHTRGTLHREEATVCHLNMGLKWYLVWVLCTGMNFAVKVFVLQK
ncbi:myelin transcription factor 1-like protein [Platysternon megacephalum]|uniref:Myelin transcription factor 1-like protein n=1 Tax=Platysternon megacephalum TaxID=55544 RepID=A0A4D9EAG8_9SAUR|nr:myelin transcription factor 1-like protein [Platysternon megacephalum]